MTSLTLRPLISLLGTEVAANGVLTDEATGKRFRALTLKVGDTTDPRKPVVLQLRYLDVNPGEPCPLSLVRLRLTQTPSVSCL